MHYNAIMTTTPTKDAAVPASVQHRTSSIGLVSAIAALGGILFGYDTGVMSGALLFIKPDFDMSATQEGVITSILMIGAALGALSGGRLADAIGRRWAVFWAGILFIVASLACAFSGGTSAAAATVCLSISRFFLGVAVGLAEGLQANLRDGTGISEYLCEAPAQPLKYGALTPHLEGVMADETEQSQESADLQPFIDDMLKALSDNPNAEVKVAKKEDSKAIIVYNFHADDIKDKISDKSLSGIHMSREEGNHAIEEMTADRHTITYHAEKQDDKWCVQDR